MEKQDIKNLKKRYLVWFYKTAKEALDKIERKFTQAEIDRFILKELKKAGHKKELEKFIADFETYIVNKENQGRELKYKNGKLRPEYSFLVLKLAVIEKAIVQELGQKALSEIKSLYESEMTERILKSTEH
ncbi:MAG: hypothetical protein FJZ13_04770 [Candidatus Omnitrophica bacterium]|nr:hypothetical protein [Candidatus Omnitrophota bacterium]